MRILMLAQFYSPIIGGEERLVQDLSIELARRGHEVAVVTLWHEGLPEYAVEGDVRIYRIRGLAQRVAWLYSEDGRRHAPPWPDPEIVRNLRRVVLQERPEIVHAHNWLLYSFLPLKAWSRARLVVTLHDYSAVCATKRLMYQGKPCSGPGLSKCLTCATQHYGVPKGVPVVAANWAMNLARRAGLVDMYLPISQAVADWSGLAKARLPYHVVPNFVPDDVDSRRDTGDPRLSQLPDTDYILCVGDLSRDKGVDVLLEAYAGLTQPPPLVLIGRNYLDSRRALPPNVVLVNKWPHTLVMEAWHRSLIALAPSTWPEPFGIVVIEAMAAGRPVIATRTGGLTDVVVDGETGLLVSAGNADQLREAIASLLADPELRERMGRAGRLRVADYQASAVVPRVERVYAELLATQPALGQIGRLKGERQGSRHV